MNNIVKKLYVGRCYVCGKPIREDDMYGTMEDSDTLYCEACWYEYAERCDALMEQMKKEKGQAAGCIFGKTPSENTCRFCGVNCGVRAPGANGVSSTELVPSEETVGLSIMAYLDSKVKDGHKVCGVTKEAAREWISKHVGRIETQAKFSKLDNEAKDMYESLFGTDIINRREYVSIDTFTNIARHFYELGLNARKEKTK